MATISTAVGTERRSRVSGYKLNKGFFSNVTPNLPQRIALFGEANTANQSGLTTAKRQITSAQEAGELYGYGSPIHSQARILFPVGSEGVGGIPVYVFPQVSDGAATATVRAWTVTGTATSNTTHYLVVNGRESLDFQTYGFSVVAGDTPTIIAGKMRDAINAVLGAPASGTAALGVATFTTKWEGLTSAEFTISVNTGNNAAGVSYAETTSTDGAGVISLAASFSQFGDDWYTCCTNPYGADQFTAFEGFNGIPDTLNPTGRYVGIIFKPFVALFGSILGDKDDIIAITDASARKSQVTNVLCPAPNSSGFTWEAAANVASLFVRVAQNNPHLDVNALSYPDMPVPADENIGDMADYTNRDQLVKAGSSTVMLVDGAYQIQDLVTTYHPAGEQPLQYAYTRNLNLDWNISFKYRLRETRDVKDKALVPDNQTVDVTGVIKPREWKASVYEVIDECASIALIADPQFAKDSVQVQISTINPDRFETAFRYKRTGIARIESTDVTAGF